MLRLLPHRKCFLESGIVGAGFVVDRRSCQTSVVMLRLAVVEISPDEAKKPPLC